jgi:Retrotransposon gag protein
MEEAENLHTPAPPELRDPNEVVPVTVGLLQEIYSRLDYLDGCVQTLRAEKEQLVRDLSSAQSVLISNAAKLGNIDKPRPSEAKLPDPPAFSGERKSVLPFIAKCRMKFEGQSSLFPDERSKVLYAGTRLEGPAFSWFQPIMNRWKTGSTPPSEIATFDSLAKSLETLYGDPHLAVTAERELRALRQAYDPVAVYAAKFEEHRQYLQWNDAALRDQFYNGLWDRIKDQMAPLERPETLEKMKELALRLDARLAARREERRTAPNPGPHPPQARPLNQPPQPARPHDRSQQTNPSNNQNSSLSPAPATGLRVPSHTPDGTVPMELGATRWHLSEAEKQRRRERNLCLYCGEANHRAYDCPSAPPPRVPFGVPFGGPPRSQPRFQPRAIMTFDLSDPTETPPEKEQTQE